MRTLMLFFGTDRLTFLLHTSNPEAIQKTREYHSFSAEIDDVVNVRIYQGIHFRFADTTARKQGIKVATWAFNHFLQPVESDGPGTESDEED